MKRAVFLVFILLLAVLVAGCQKEEQPIMPVGGDAYVPDDLAKNTQGGLAVDEKDEMAEQEAVDALVAESVEEFIILDAAIKDFAFSPAEIKLKKGAAVKWKNFDSAPHDVTSLKGTELASETLQTGNEYQHTFNEAGVFEYYCSIHPRMKAKVVVE